MKKPIVPRPRRPDEKDDTARIQEAVNEAARLGVEVKFVDQHHQISDTIRWPSLKDG